ncbi:MAG TPA: YciI family protein [Acidimicrobiales bacterium]|jgi:hypothetical protein|nr:YciI family protein [Acidimicrobiales bacterium]
MGSQAEEMEDLMAEFLLLYMYGPGEPPAPLPPDELEAVIARYVAWSERMAASGHGSDRRGARLTNVFTDPGRVLSAGDGEVVATDGPLAETKEVVGGWAVITAADYDEVHELCRDHPGIGGGSHILVRQLA